MSDTAVSEGRAALAAYDRALAAKPSGDNHAFAETTQRLCAMRHLLIAKGRDPASRKQLETLNAVISSVLAGHFPLGGIPWPEVEHARHTLADLVEQVG
ncbi:MAG: hypothetical protein RQ966_16530 [Acetobacteraceae bacterium]|nr:hypothetical protein [Acetobacteraceae bacterium]